MKRPASSPTSITATWELARSGNLRGAVEAARKALGELGPDATSSSHVELHLVAAFCAMRQGDHSEAMRELDAATHAASSPQVDGRLELRVETWRAELAYFQGRYSAATEIIDRVLEPLEQRGNWAYAAFALRIRIAILLARADYEGIAAQADRAVRDAEKSGDDYVMVQVLNVLGAFHFDCATSKLPEPHARGQKCLKPSTRGVYGSPSRRQTTSWPATSWPIRVAVVPVASSARSICSARDGGAAKQSS